MRSPEFLLSLRTAFEINSKLFCRPKSHTVKSHVYMSIRGYQGDGMGYRILSLVIRRQRLSVRSTFILLLFLPMVDGAFTLALFA